VKTCHSDDAMDENTRVITFQFVSAKDGRPVESDTQSDVGILPKSRLASWSSTKPGGRWRNC